MPQDAADNARPTSSSPPPLLADRATVEYFDAHQHTYSRARIRGVAKLVRRRLRPGSRLIDVGCGTGDNLKLLSEALGITDITGLDVSQASLDRAAELMPDARLECASLLDREDLKQWEGQFDGVVIAAVLHHLVGPTRRASRADAEAGLRNALSLAKPGGLLIVLEPVFTPRVMVSSLFWVKRAATAATGRRIPLFGYWNNIGAPVVSFYSLAEVRAMAEASGAEVIKERVEDKALGYADRVFSKADATVICRRPRVAP